MHGKHILRMVRYCLVNQLSKSLEFEGGLHCLLEEEEGLQGFLDLLRLPRLEPRADTAEKRTRGNQGFYVAVVFLGEPPSDLRVGTALEGLEQRCFGDVVDPARPSFISFRASTSGSGLTMMKR